MHARSKCHGSGDTDPCGLHKLDLKDPAVPAGCLSCPNLTPMINVLFHGVYVSPDIVAIHAISHHFNLGLGPCPWTGHQDGIDEDATIEARGPISEIAPCITAGYGAF